MRVTWNEAETTPRSWYFWCELSEVQTTTSIRTLTKWRTLKNAGKPTKTKHQHGKRRSTTRKPTPNDRLKRINTLSSKWCCWQQPS